MTEHFGIKHAKAVLGWSMGAGQTYQVSHNVSSLPFMCSNKCQWATQFPEFMDIIVPFCGAAKTALHNQVFLEGIKSALLAAKKHSSAGPCAGGQLPKDEEFRTWSEEEKTVGLKAFGRVYAGWGFSQAFYVSHTLFRLQRCADFHSERSCMRHTLVTEILKTSWPTSGKPGLYQKVLNSSSPVTNMN